MIDFGRYRLSANAAATIVTRLDDEIDRNPELIRGWARFEVKLDDDFDHDYKELRDGIVSVFSAEMEQRPGDWFDLDLKVGLKLYEFLNPTAGFRVATASDDDVWRYMSVRVMPDLTFIRYPNRSDDIEIIKEVNPTYSQRLSHSENGANHIRKKRFFSGENSRRIWLKTLWWYVHLGWQENSEDTYKALCGNGSDSISQLIERPGRGYRTELCRKLMRVYSEQKNKSTDKFKAAMRLNLVKCVSVEPMLSEGGEEGYCKRLFDELPD